MQQLWASPPHQMAMLNRCAPSAATHHLLHTSPLCVVPRFGGLRSCCLDQTAKGNSRSPLFLALQSAPPLLEPMALILLSLGPALPLAPQILRAAPLALVPLMLLAQPAPPVLVLVRVLVLPPPQVLASPPLPSLLLPLRLLRLLRRRLPRPQSLRRPCRHRCRCRRCPPRSA